MGKNEHSWLSVDLAEERQGESDEDFDAAVAIEARTQAQAIRRLAAGGSAELLSDLAEAWADRVSQEGVTENLIRVALSCGPAVAGQMLVDLVQKCIDAQAELSALALVEKRAGVTV